MSFLRGPPHQILHHERALSMYVVRGRLGGQAMSERMINLSREQFEELREKHEKEAPEMDFLKWLESKYKTDKEERMISYESYLNIKRGEISWRSLPLAPKNEEYNMMSALLNAQYFRLDVKTQQIITLEARIKELEAERPEWIRRAAENGERAKVAEARIKELEAEVRENEWRTRSIASSLNHIIDGKDELQALRNVHNKVMVEKLQLCKKVVIQEARIKELETDINEITGVCQKCRSPLQWCDCKKEAKQ